jgi:malate synthase
LDKDVKDGINARSILENELFVRFFDDYSENLHEARSKLKENDDVGRKQLDNMNHCGWLFKKFLEHYISQGEISLEEIRRLQDRPKTNWLGGIV